ncbi:MAG TPA: MarR family winged helix-turn-helix transcriptional regulator [Caulobacteraceae bacterium]
MAVVKGRPDVELLALVSMIDRNARMALQRVLPAGVSVADFSVLSRLDHDGASQSPGALAAALGVSRSAMTATLQGLHARGLATVVSDDSDARRKWVAATILGWAANRACLEAARTPSQALRRAFATQEFEQALPFLRRLRAHLEAGF